VNTVPEGGRRAPGRGSGRPALLGADPLFRATLDLARRVARGTSPVLLIGPTGSGKTQIAKALHHLGAHPEAPFLEWHAGAVPESLLEAELFGVSRGAATGVRERPGAFESAGQGTLCLVGIELLRPQQQAVLLRALENQAVERVGSSRPMKIACRLLASFLEAPELLVASGRLRADLLYRLDVIRLELPPLAHRREDVPLLARHFLGKACKRLGRPVPGIAPPLMRALQDHWWPGNLRELAQLMEGLALRGQEVLTADDLPASFFIAADPVEEGLTGRMTLHELKSAYIRAVLARVGGNRTRAARWLGVSRKALWAHLRREGS
jgi:two-component system response regulator HydG